MNGNEIISLILNDLGIKAPTFAKNIGLKYQRILDIQSGKTKKISPAVANSIVERYPQFNKVWILTGEGDMRVSGMVIQQGTGNINGSVIENSSFDNRQYFSDSPDVLRAQIEQLEQLILEKEARLAEKDKQIAEKDKQIAGLITALNK